MAIVARNVRVTGRVQGVFFRAWTRDKAREMGIAGWVRNCRDGSVEAHFEGKESRLRSLVELLSDGPTGSAVDRVESVVAEVEQMSGFEVRY